MDTMNIKTARQISSDTTSEMIARLSKTNPWQAIEILQKQNALLDNQVDALRAEVVRLVNEIAELKRTSGKELS